VGADAAHDLDAAADTRAELGEHVLAQPKPDQQNRTAAAQSPALHRQRHPSATRMIVSSNRHPCHRSASSWIGTFDRLPPRPHQPFPTFSASAKVHMEIPLSTDSRPVGTHGELMSGPFVDPHGPTWTPSDYACTLVRHSEPNRVQ